MDLTFHVVFVPGTVRYLRLPVATLLYHSPYRYRLVANALGPAELRLLRDFVAASDRLELFAYDASAPLAHGTMLNLLLPRESSPWFCFADSDIFAVEPFAPALEANLQDVDVFSSCCPSGWDACRVLPGFDGLCVRSPAGLPLAVTYFAAYRRRPLQQLVQDTGIGFETCRPPLYLPPFAARHPFPDDLRAVPFLDTGKLLNVVASRFNLRFSYRPLPALSHVGGLSSYVLRDSWRRALRRRLMTCLRRSYLLRDDDLAQALARRARGRAARRRAAFPADLEADYLRARVLRQRTALFFAHWLRSIVDGSPPPRFQLQNEPLRHTIQRTCQALEALLAQPPWRSLFAR